MGKKFCVEFQRYPLKFHTKYLTHILKDAYFIHRSRHIRALRFKSSYEHLKCPLELTNEIYCLFWTHNVVYMLLMLWCVHYCLILYQLGHNWDLGVTAYELDRVSKHQYKVSYYIFKGKQHTVFYRKQYLVLLLVSPESNTNINSSIFLFCFFYLKSKPLKCYKSW